MRDTHEEQLFQKTRTGDIAAADELIRGWHMPFVGFIARITGAGQAADIAQDTYLALFDRFHTFKNAIHARRFMYKTGYRKAIDAYRAAQRHNRIQSGIKAAHCCAPRATHSKPLAYHDLHEAISRLPAQQQAVIALKIQHDFTAREIAAHLGIPLGTALYRIHKAITSLRHCLSQTGITGKEQTP